MGRRKLGQPRVHRIVILDQYSNEVESHELDESGRLKEKISNTKKSRSVNLLSNNINGNIQGQANRLDANKDYQRAYINLPRIPLNNLITPENNIDINNNSNVNSAITDLNENNQQLGNFNIPPLDSISNPPLNSTNELQGKINKQTQNIFNDAQNQNQLKNIPQPQISHQMQDNISHTFKKNRIQAFQQIQPEENETRPLEIINNQSVPNSIPIPIVISPNINKTAQINSNNYMPSPFNQINDYISQGLNTNQFQKKPIFSSLNSKYFTHQIIFEFPEEPKVPLFIAADDF